MGLYLVRHTQVDMPKGICYGHADVPLATSFDEELAEVRAQLRGVDFRKAFSSPLQRCVTLARELTDQFVTDERIKEFNFGRWERQPWTDIYEEEAGKRWFDDYVNTSTPQGESFQMMLERVRRFIRDLPAGEENILIVTHAGIIRAFLILLKGYSVDRAFDTPVRYGEVVVLENIRQQQTGFNKKINQKNSDTPDAKT